MRTVIDLPEEQISWMEVLVGAPSEDLRMMREDFLRQFSIVELDKRVARDAIGLREERRLKLRDAIGWASARLNDALLVTRNTKDFPAHESGVRIPYQVCGLKGCILCSAVS